jgi:hypothetical protein
MISKIGPRTENSIYRLGIEIRDYRVTFSDTQRREWRDGEGERVPVREVEEYAYQAILIDPRIGSIMAFKLA